MNFFYYCLQGVIAGGIVGITLGPLAASGLRFWHQGKWRKLAAILCGGTLGDSFLAAILLIGTSFASEFDARVRYLEHPLWASFVLIVMGIVGLKMARRCGPHAPPAESGWSLDPLNARMIFGISFSWNFFNGDTFVAFPLGVVVAGIGTLEENVARLVGFVPAAFVGTVATIVGFEVLARIAHREFIPWLVRITSAFGIASGVYVLCRYFI